MNSLRNSVRLVGHLGNNPEVKEIASGKKVVKISLATNESFKKNGDQVTETQWHNLVAWGKTADIAEKYLQKGQEVCIEGRLNNRSWEDADGNMRYATEVVINELLMVGKKAS
ncbi:MAG: single-stranded DNA-binding protein [Bacteroidetes bacterium]|jgi:single-strand DNA-binding protein|nr:single-stranded DNA-binding protein [Bacteroidota bacterium]